MDEWDYDYYGPPSTEDTTVYGGDNSSWIDNGDGTLTNQDTGETQDQFGNPVETAAAGGDDSANDDANWIPNGDGTWTNGVTGEVQDDAGNSLGYVAPLFDDPNSGLQPRDGAGGSDYSPPVDVATGGGLLSGIGSIFSGVGGFLTNLLGGGSNDGRPNTGGMMGGGNMGGGSSSSGSNQSQQQQALQRLQAQLTAAQRAHANPNVIAALQNQIRQAGGMSDAMKTLLLAGAVGAVVFVATRKNRAA